MADLASQVRAICSAHSEKSSILHSWQMQPEIRLYLVVVDLEGVLKAQK